MPVETTLTKGDLTKFSTTFKKATDGTVVNFSGGTATFIYRFNGGPWTKVNATDSTPASGTAEYAFPTGIPKGGFMEYLWKMTDITGLVYHANDIESVTVRGAI